MAAFVRFVFTILIVGMTVNLAIVLLANAQSQRRQETQYQHQAEQFKALIADIGGHVRRADVVVEAQRVDAREKVLESTLLVRQYRTTGTAQGTPDNPPPVVRIVISGDQLEAHGLLVEFGAPFSGPQDDTGGGEYAMLRNVQLVFFGCFCGAGEAAPTAPNAPDDRFTFLPRDQVPELVRLDPRARQPSYFELKLWQYLWTQLPEVPRDAKLPWVSQSASHVKATWMKPATITVRRLHTYTAFVAVDGSITLGEDVPGISGLLDVMLKEGAKLDQMPPE